MCLLDLLGLGSRLGKGVVLRVSDESKSKSFSRYSPGARQNHGRYPALAAGYFVCSFSLYLKLWNQVFHTPTFDRLKAEHVKVQCSMVTKEFHTQIMPHPCGALALALPSGELYRAGAVDLVE